MIIRLALFYKCNSLFGKRKKRGISNPNHELSALASIVVLGPMKFCPLLLRARVNKILTKRETKKRKEKGKERKRYMEIQRKKNKNIIEVEKIEGKKKNSTHCLNILYKPFPNHHDR